jgi:hypothetical protein
MPQSDPAETAGPNPDNRPENRPKRRMRDRHGRRAQPTTTTTGSTRTGPRSTTGPRYTVGPPKTTPMTPEQYQRAVHAWAVLIAAWWTEHPPGQHDEDSDD